MRKSTFLRTMLIVLGVVLALIAGLAVWYETTSYRPGDTDPSPTLLRGATVLTGPELTPTENADVLIEGGRITRVGPDLADAAPADAQIRDLTGMTLLPGLIDLHVHLGLEQAASVSGPLDMPRVMANYIRLLPDARRNLLAAGVTTVRDLGNDPFILELRDGVEDGSLEGPRVFAAGPVFSTAGGHPLQTIFGGDFGAASVLTPTTPDQARQEVRQQAENGVDLIKVIQERGGSEIQLDPIPVDVLEAIVDEAHVLDLKVVAHWGRLADLAEVRAAGVDELAHLESYDLMDGWPPEVLAEVAGSGIPVAPSMLVAVSNQPPERRERLIRQTAQFYAAGGTVLAGSDTGMPGIGYGPGLQGELALLVEAGLSPTEALQAATSAAARELGRPDLGEIRGGATADLVAVEGRPHEQITDVTQVRLVLRDGRVVFTE